MDGQSFSKLYNLTFLKTVLMLCVIVGHSVNFWKGTWFTALTQAYDIVALCYISDFMNAFHIFAMLLSTSMSFGIMAVSKTFVPLFYGSGYDLCILLYLILLPSCPFFAFGNVIRTQYLLPNEFDAIYVKSAFLGAGVNIIINLLLIPNLGALGAAIGTLVAEATVCIYQALKISRNIDIKKYALRSTPFIISGIVMFIVIYNLNLPIDNNIIKLLTEIVCGAILYLLCILIQLGITYRVLKINWLK